MLSQKDLWEISGAALEDVLQAQDDGEKLAFIGFWTVPRHHDVDGKWHDMNMAATAGAEGIHAVDMVWTMIKELVRLGAIIDEDLLYLEQELRMSLKGKFESVNSESVEKGME